MVEALVVRTVEHTVLKGVLTVHVHCMGIPHIHQRYVSGAQCLESGSWDRSFFEVRVTSKITPIF